MITCIKGRNDDCRADQPLESNSYLDKEIKKERKRFFL